MATKVKNKIKKKNKAKTSGKINLSTGKKKKTVKKIVAENIVSKKNVGALNANEPVHNEKIEMKRDESAKDSAGEKTENTEDAHLAKWTAPSFVLTNSEVLIYRLCAIGSPLMVIASIFQGNHIVSITFFLAFFVSVMQLVKKPVAMECLIDLDGIKMGDKLYGYRSIESFEVDEEVNMLKFKLKNAIMPVREIYLEDQDPNYIRAVLEYFLPEEKQEAVLLSRERKGETGEGDMSDEELLSYLDKMEKKIEREDL